MIDWKKLAQNKWRWLLIGLGVIGLSGVTFYLTLLLLLGSVETVTVPDLVGTELITALDELGKLGVSARVSSMEMSEQYEKGKIIRQYPSSGRRIKRGRSVQLTVSQGLSELAMVDLLGMDQKVAEQTLANNALTAKHILSTCSEATPGKVVAQKPAPFQKLARNDTIEIAVSYGSCANFFLVPDYRGIPVMQVMTELSHTQVPTLREERAKHRSRSRLKDEVLDQEPPAGHLVAVHAVHHYAGAQVLRLGVPVGFRAEEESALKLYYVNRQMPYGFKNYKLKIRTYLPDLSTTEIDIDAAPGKSIAWAVPILSGLTPELTVVNE